MTATSEKRLKKRIAKLVYANPDLVMKALLNTPFWPQDLDATQQYKMFGDDDNSFLRIVFSKDGDVWPSIFTLEHEGDPRDPSSTPRFRTYFGGGRSMRTRAALCILAVAIKLDNAERPQRRAP